MKRAIWKWTLTPECHIEMPQGAVVLDVQEQHGEPQLWALVNPSAPKEKRLFKWYGTGHTINHGPGVYVGTFQLRNGGLVFHVFERVTGAT